MISTEVKKYHASLAVRAVLLALIVIGGVSWFLIYQEDHTRAWMNYLIGTMMFMGMGLFGLFFVAVNNITGGKWMTVLRRVFEGMSLTLIIGSVLLLGVYLLRNQLFEWTIEEFRQTDYLMQAKLWYLNDSFFTIRTVFYIVAMVGSALFLVRSSLKQDQISNSVKPVMMQKNASAIVIMLFAISVSGLGFDYLMSLEPHWFSTMYGVYYFAGLFQAGLATAYVVVAYLYKKGLFEGFVNKAHFHDLGKFVFAFSVFWAYIAFSQFMLYWYGNLPEETFWYNVRMQDGWQWMGLSLLFVRWLLPFLVLLPFGSKLNFKIAVPVCFVLIFGQWLDLFWNAMPATRLLHHGAEAAEHISHFGVGFGWQELAVGVGFFSLFLLILSFILERLPLVPVGDPRIEASIHHHI